MRWKIIVILLMLLGGCKHHTATNPRESKSVKSQPVVGHDASQVVEMPSKRKNTDLTIKKQRATLSPNALKQIRTNNSWVLVEGGRFEMGATIGRRDNRPLHAVILADFFIQQTEVTVSQYAKCVDQKKCHVPVASYADELCNWEDGNWRKKNLAHHPANCVTWQQASTYCKWLGGLLPTEAQWEYAARSKGKKISYPWGGDSLTCDYAVVYDIQPGQNKYDIDEAKYGCGTGRTFDVCSKPIGNTEQGLCDMTGNVWEWVQDTYDARRYEHHRLDEHNTVNNAIGLDKVLRGGTYISDEQFSKTTDRGYSYVAHTDSKLGFRCVKNTQKSSSAPPILFESETIRIASEKIVFKKWNISGVFEPQIAHMLKRDSSPRVFEPVTDDEVGISSYTFGLNYNLQDKATLELQKIDSPMPNSFDAFDTKAQSVTQYVEGTTNELKWAKGVLRVRGHGFCESGQCITPLVKQVTAILMMPLSEDSYVKCIVRVKNEPDVKAPKFLEYFDWCKSINLN